MDLPEIGTIMYTGFWGGDNLRINGKRCEECKINFGR